MSTHLPADWNFIWLGYGVVWGGIVLYGLSLLWRFRKHRVQKD
jgi:hypothetical protein